MALSALEIFFIIYFSVPAVLLLIYTIRRVQIVEQGTALIIERFGKFHKRANAGLHILVPLADEIRYITWRETDVTITQGYRGNLSENVLVKQSSLSRIDMRENIMDFCNQSIITRDNVAIDVHPMLVFRLTDPVRVAYETFDLAHAVEKLVQTTLRSVIGDMGLDDTLASREEIERGLASRIKHICHDWGLEIKSVELLEITPSNSVQTAMHKQIGAERVRRADIVTADGIREKLKLEAEGHMQAAIALATGQQRVSIIQATGSADAKLSIAQAESESVGIIAKALAEYDVNPAQYIVGLKYIQTLASIAGRASKRTVYFPYEADVVGSLAEVSR